MKKTAIALALSVFATAALATPAPATSVTGYTNFTGNLVGGDTVNMNNVLYGFEEQTLKIDTAKVGNHYTLNGSTVSKAVYEALNPYDNQTVKSFFVFFDPAKQGSINGSVTFQNSILGVFDSKAELSATQVFQKSGVTYNLSAGANGLEGNDTASFSGNKLSLNWKANNPGDHIRVLTAVPEPETYAMFLAGLGIMGAVVRRRRIQG